MKPNHKLNYEHNIEIIEGIIDLLNNDNFLIAKSKLKDLRDINKINIYEAKKELEEVA